jgi:recombinational DNA repair protein (RecF pathway)
MPAILPNDKRIVTFAHLTRHPNENAINESLAARAVVHLFALVGFAFQRTDFATTKTSASYNRYPAYSAGSGCRNAQD